MILKTLGFKYVVFELFLALFVSQSHAQSPAPINLNAMHEEAMAITQKILKAYKPDEHLYIGIGRSPTLILEYLRAHEGDVRYLPLSFHLKTYPTNSSAKLLLNTMPDTLKVHIKKFF